MDLLDESGWQSEKTLAECMRYMLDNEIATDVCFEVGPPDRATVNIRAHKFMLISRSAVFEAMFNSGMTECRSGPHAMIRVEDIEADIFKDLLSYIYCDVVSINFEGAASLMYAAKKYMLPKLVTECGKCLSEALNANNVIQVLEQSLLFDATELKSKCLELIVQNSRTVLTGSEIMSASRQTMDTILKMDEILVREITIYETCIAWAKHQLLIQRSTENPTDQHIREILGDLLYKIRFPTMDVTEFAEISESKNVLTGEEKASIYYFLVTKKKGSQLMFSSERRRTSEETFIDRAVTCLTGLWSGTPILEAINFTVDQDIWLSGIGLYTGLNGSAYNVLVEIFCSTNSLFKKNVTVLSIDNAKQFKVSMDVPIPIKSGVVYTVKALPADGQIGHYGRPCQTICTTGEVTVTFSRHSESPSTNETDGQIPRLYFCY